MVLGVGRTMHPPRVSGFTYVGMHRYLLTLCTARRAPVFWTDRVVAPVLEQFRQSALRELFAIVAYCFMLDHLHLVCVASSESSDLRRFVADARQRSGYAYRQSYGNHLWQHGYYDHVLRDDEATLAVVRYVLANPIRAGLTTVLGEYRFAGSDVFTIGEIAECLQMWTPSWHRQP
jgi:putative transposase